MKEDELNKLKGDNSASAVKIIDPPLQKKIKKKLPAKMTLGESSESNSEEEKTELFQNFKMKTNIEVRLPIKAGDNLDTQEDELKAIDAKLKELKGLNLAKNIKLSFFYFDGFKQVKSVTVPKSTKVANFWSWRGSSSARSTLSSRGSRATTFSSWSLTSTSYPTT